MELELTLLAVPALTLAVLGTLLATAGRRAHTACVGVLGLAGVMFGGPGTVFVLSASAAEREAAVRTVSTLNAEAGPQAETADAATVDTEKTETLAAERSGAAEADGGEIGRAAVDSTGSTDSVTAPTTDSATPLHEPILQEGVTYLDEVPEWVNLDRVRGEEIDRSVVSSDPFSTTQDCTDDLDTALVKQTNDYIDWHLKRTGASHFVNFDLDYIDRHLVKDRFHQHMVVSVGPMQRKFALLEFDQDFRNEVKRQWDDARASSRLLLAGLFGGGAIGLLGVLFGFFKLDNATRGFYTGRLQFATLAAILGIIAAGVLVARWIPWL